MADQKKHELNITRREPQRVSLFIQTESYWNMTLNEKGRQAGE